MTPRPDFTTGWDWYGCTLVSPPQELVGRLAKATQSDPEMLTRAGRWTALWRLHRGEDVICTVGSTDLRPDEPFFESKSHSPELVPLVREWFPQHRVARADARIDFHDDLWWDVIEPVMRDYHESRGILLVPDGPHTQPSMGGRTWNGGKSESWQRCVTLYEKGCELQLPTRSPIRLEAKVRPPSRLKAHYASLSINEVLLDNRFIRHLLPRIGVDLGQAIVAPCEKNRTDLDRLLDVFARQYLPTFKLLAERYLSVAELRDELERRANLDAEIRNYRSKAEVTKAWAG